MFETLKTTHSHTRWLILLAAVIVIIMALVNKRKAYSNNDNLAGLFFMILCDVQLLIGLILYFGLSNNGLQAWQDYGMGLMKIGPIRKIAVEHLILMLAALTMVHIGRSKIKKAADDTRKHTLSLRYYGIALILILAGIPWERL